MLGYRSVIDHCVIDHCVIDHAGTVTASRARSR